MKKCSLIVILFLFSGRITFCQTQTKEETSQFIYVLHLVPKYLDKKIWADEDNKTIKEHFDRLKKMYTDGLIILAGKTETWDEKMFGIVIYNAASLEKAKEIAENDPAVKKGIMTVEVYPYKIALIQEKHK
jgi:uncharacterized protein